MPANSCETIVKSSSVLLIAEHHSIAVDVDVYTVFSVILVFVCVFVFQRAQPEIVTFLGYESENALYSIPGKCSHLLLISSLLQVLKMCSIRKKKKRTENN